MYIGNKLSLVFFILGSCASYDLDDIAMSTTTKHFNKSLNVKTFH